jgi:hypothetical protein
MVIAVKTQIPLKKLLLMLMFCVAVCRGQAPANNQPGASFHLHNQEFVVKLLSPLSTKTSKPGDAFTASVQSPAQFQGGIMEGRITSLKKAEKGVGKGKTEILFEFNTLTFSGQTAHVAADLHDISNSKGVKDVDEEGRVIGKSSNKKRFLSTALGAGGGALIGGLTGGATGAVIGGVAGGAAGLAIGLTMTSTASDIELQPGSLFTLTVSDAQNKRH